MSGSSSSHAEEIRAEQIGLLYRQAPLALAAIVINSILLTAIMWSEASQPLLLAWLGLTLLLTLNRAFLVRAYRRASPEPSEARRWALWFVLGTALSGLAWGAAGALFFTNSHVHRVILAFLLGGMAAGGLSTLSSYPGAYRAFLLPALLPYTVRVFLQGGPLYASMGSMLLLFVAMMIAISHRLYLTIWNSLALRFANLDLLDDLADARDQQAAINRELQAEIEERQRTQTALEEREALVQAVINSLPASIAVIDQVGTVIEVNHAWQRCADGGSDPLMLRVRAGLNYLSACRNAVLRDRRAKQVLDAVEAVLQGRDTEFAIEYPHDGPTGAQWSMVCVNRLKSARGGAVVSHIDITHRKQAEERLLLAAVFENANEGILIVGHRWRIVAVNKAFTRITRYMAQETLDRPVSALVSYRHGRAFFRELWTSLRRTGHWQGEVWARRKSGEPYPAWLGVNAVRDASGAISRYVAIFSDITRLKEAERDLYHLAYKDTLTELPNRVLFRERLQHALTQAQRHGLRVGLLFLDLDRFKLVNDTLGHDIGDRLLQQVAARLSHCVRAGDTVARLGGDEFTVILEQIDQGEDAATVAQKVAEALSQSFIVEGNEIYTSASIGISVFPNDADAPSTLIKNADAAMYRAKEQGRARHQFYSADLNAYSRERLWLDANLRRALERGELELYYQPLVSVADGTIKKLEALLRWHHPERGWIPPADFIPVAEETGLIVPLGEWVLREACSKVCRHDGALISFGIGSDSATPILAVNLSAHQLRQRSLVPLLTRLREETGADSLRLELELTESQLMQNTEVALDTLHALKELGVRIAIDDFGTGYSSLSYLKRFPVDVVKIDRSFVADITHDGEDAAIVRAVIAIAHTLKLEVVAEGVETIQQLALLREWQCDTAQGYYFSPPLTSTELTRLLQGWGRLPLDAIPGRAH